MFSKRLLLTAIAASFSAACAVGPDYARPETPLPAHYLGQAAVAERPAQAEADLGAWWHGFGDPQLARYVTAALAQNLDLAQAAARVTQARAGLGAAQAALLPSGNITAQGARAWQSLETPAGRMAASAPDADRFGNAYEVNLGLAWELDFFGGGRRGKEAAHADYQASQAGAAAVRLAVAAQTADIYIGIRAFQERIAVARRQIQTQQELLATITRLHERGLAATLQLRQAEGALAQVRAALPVLEAGLDTAMNALDVMLGTAPGTHRAELAEAVAIPVAPRVADAGAPGDLLRRRPDLIAAERRLAASNARIGVAIAEYYPQFSLTGMLGSATSVASGHLFTGDASQAAGVLGLRWRLFDFGRINAQIALAKGQEAEALAAYRLSVLRASEEVENAFSALVRREQQAVILGDGVAALAEARAASFAAYQHGVVSLVEVLQADEQELRARDARAQARAESARAAVAAFRALGGGWSAPAPSSLARR